MSPAAIRLDRPHGAGCRLPRLGTAVKMAVAAQSSIDMDELVEHWTVFDDEALVGAKRGTTRLGFALLLKFYSRLAASRPAARICPVR